MLLGVLGIADSFYLAQHELTNTALSCGIGNLSGCNIVAQSPYAKIFGIPLGILGIVFYTIVLATFLVTYVKRSSLLFRGLAFVTTVGVLFSLYFAYLQVFVIKAICIYCMASAILTVLLWVLAFMLWRKPHLLAPRTL